MQLKNIISAALSVSLMSSLPVMPVSAAEAPKTARVVMNNTEGDTANWKIRTWYGGTDAASGDDILSGKAVTAVDPENENNKVLDITIPQSKDGKALTQTIMWLPVGSVGSSGKKAVVSYKMYANETINYNNSSNPTDSKKEMIAYPSDIIKALDKGFSQWNTNTGDIARFTNDTANIPDSSSLAMLGKGATFKWGQYYSFLKGWNNITAALDFDTHKVHYYIEGYDFGEYNMAAQTPDCLKYLSFIVKSPIAYEDGTNYHLYLDDIKISEYADEFLVYSDMRTEEVSAKDGYKINFTNPVSISSLKEKLTVSDASGNKLEPKITLSSDGMSADVNIEDGFEYASHYTIKIAKGVSDDIGNTSTAEYSTSITTAYAEMHIDGCSIQNGDFAADPGNIKIYFDKKISAEALKDALTVDGEYSSFDVSTDKDGMTATVEINDYASKSPYTIRLKSGFCDASGKAKLSKDFEVSFTSKEITYMEIAEDNLGENVDPTNIRIKFSKELSESSLSGFVQIYDADGNKVDAEKNVKFGENNEWLYISVPELLGNTDYTIEISKSISAKDGSILSAVYRKSFKTAEYKNAKIIDMYVKSSNSNGTEIIINFNCKMTESEISEHVSVYDGEDKTKAEYTVCMLNDNYTASVKINGLEADKEYTAVFSGNFKTESGCIITGESIVKFEENHSDFLKITKTSIADGEINIDFNPVITISFSKEITAENAQSYITLCDESGNATDYSVTVNGNTAEISASELKSGMIYKLSVAKEIGLNDEYILSFKTKNSDEEHNNTAEFINSDNWVLNGSNSTLSVNSTDEDIEFSRPSAEGVSNMVYAVGEDASSRKNKIVTYSFGFCIPKGALTTGNTNTYELFGMEFDNKKGEKRRAAVYANTEQKNEDSAYLALYAPSGWTGSFYAPYDKWNKVVVVYDYLTNNSVMQILNEKDEVLMEKAGTSTSENTNLSNIYAFLAADKYAGNVQDPNFCGVIKFKDFIVSCTPAFRLELSKANPLPGETLNVVSTKKLAKSNIETLTYDSVSLKKSTGENIEIESISFAEDMMSFNIALKTILESNTEYVLSISNEFTSVDGSKFVFEDISFVTSHIQNTLSVTDSSVIYTDKSGTEINSVQRASQAKYSFKVDNNTTENKEISVVCAAYKNGAMVSCTNVRKYSVGAYASAHISDILAGLSECDEIKVLIIEEKSAVPMNVYAPIIFN